MYQKGQILKIKNKTDLYAEVCQRSEEEFAQGTNTFHSIKYSCRYAYHISDSFIQSVCGEDVVVLGSAVCPEWYSVKSLSSNQQLLLFGWMLEDTNNDALESQELDEFLNSYVKA